MAFFKSLVEMEAAAKVGPDFEANETRNGQTLRVRFLPDREEGRVEFLYVIDAYSKARHVALEFLAASEKMVFRSINGSTKSITGAIDTAIKLMDVFPDLMHSQSGVLKNLGREVVENLIFAHEILQRMTQTGAPIGPKVGIEVRLDRLYGDFRKHIDPELTFVKGAICDPYLYVMEDGSNVGFQQGAVLNLRKAQTILAVMITLLTEEHK